MSPDTRIDTGLDPGALFSPIDFRGRLSAVVAFSGGGDSAALLHLFKAYADRTLPGLTVHAVTVDHGLRTESADEARGLGRVCERLGVAHRIQHWADPKPRSGVSAAARLARYRLLAEAARTIGTDLVLVGHNRDDLAETVSMRGARGAGRGMAGIAPATLHSGVWFIRPLLGVRRSMLRQHLESAGQGWIDDPTNTNARYERVRVRTSANDADTERLGADAEAATRRREAEGEGAALLIVRNARLISPGLVAVSPELLMEEDRGAAVYALRLLLAAVGGGEQLADMARSEGLFERLGQAGFTTTLSRSVIEVRSGRIWLRREARGLAPATIRPGDVWDRRFVLRGGPATIGPLGTEAAEDMAAEVDAPSRLVKAALAAEPALLHSEEASDWCVPGQTERKLQRLVPPWLELLPSFDLAPANALAALFDAPAFPSTPWRGHIGGEA